MSEDATQSGAVEQMQPASLTCATCGKTFGNPHGLKVHEWRSHTQVGRAASQASAKRLNSVMKRRGPYKRRLGKMTHSEAARIGGLSKAKKYNELKELALNSKPTALAITNAEPDVTQMVRFCPCCGTDLRFVIQAAKLAAKLG